MREQLNEYTEEGSFIPFAELLKLRSKYEMLVIGAHPFRPSTPLKDDPSLLKQLDAFDLNGKDLHTRGIEENINDVNALLYLLINLLSGEVIHINLCNTDPYIRF